jgi:hypothetical protein
MVSRTFLKISFVLSFTYCVITPLYLNGCTINTYCSLSQTIATSAIIKKSEPV